MSTPTIGIKLADGRLFPLLDESDHGKKRVVLSPAHPGQETARIELFRGWGEELDQAESLGILSVAGASEIELLLDFDKDGILHVSTSGPSGQSLLLKPADTKLNPPGSGSASDAVPAEAAADSDWSDASLPAEGFPETFDLNTDDLSDESSGELDGLDELDLGKTALPDDSPENEEGWADLDFDDAAFEEEKPQGKSDRELLDDDTLAVDGLDDVGALDLEESLASGDELESGESLGSLDDFDLPSLDDFTTGAEEALAAEDAPEAFAPEAEETAEDAPADDFADLDFGADLETPAEAGAASADEDLGGLDDFDMPSFDEAPAPAPAAAPQDSLDDSFDLPALDDFDAPASDEAAFSAASTEEASDLGSFDDDFSFDESPSLDGGTLEAVPFESEPETFGAPAASAAAVQPEAASPAPAASPRHRSKAWSQEEESQGPRRLTKEDKKAARAAEKAARAAEKGPSRMPFYVSLFSLVGLLLALLTLLFLNITRVPNIPPLPATRFGVEQSASDQVPAV